MRLFCFQQLNLSEAAAGIAAQILYDSTGTGKARQSVRPCA